MGRPCIAILEVSKKGIIMGYYDMITQAANELKLNKGHILQHLRGKYKTKGVCGHFFRYASWEEMQKKEEIRAWMQAKDMLKVGPVTAPVADLPESPVETIPSTWTKAVEEEVGLTAFQLLLKRSKERVGFS